MSLGSGYLLQELILLLRLIDEGFKEIILDCIEIIDNLLQQEILSAIIARLNESFNVKITVNHFNKIEDILPSDSGYNSVYGIDFTSFRRSVLNRDFSSRKLTGDLTRMNSHNILSMLIKALSRLSLHGNTSFLLTFSKDFIFQQLTSNQVSIDNYISFESFLTQGNDYDYYYIRSNVFALILHFGFIKEES